MKLFLSHSSSNNASALALELWLKENGWGDSYYLDVSETRGLVAGDRWQDALKKASHRCEAVVFLISQQWQESKWCLAEFLLAKQLGKKIFGVLIENVDIESLPKEMVAEWQLCDLANGEERQAYTVALDPLVPETKVSFAIAGLRKLQEGLKNAGIGAETFDWPPADHPERSPYPGLKPLMVEDAAIFFGRDALILRCMDEIRKMQDGGINNTLVILGASGSGKSSFMRAGIWPRLNREENRFMALPPVRPRRDAFNSDEGLIYSLQAQCRMLQVDRNLGDIKEIVRHPDRLAELLAELAAKWIGVAESGRVHRLTIILPLDQAEELYTGGEETVAGQFLDNLNNLLLRTSLSDSPDMQVDLMVLLTIRTDMFEYIQGDKHFNPDKRQILDLPAMDRTQYKTVIEGPASRSTGAGLKLTVESTLTEKLLEEMQGADALPLLAFTLERLFRDYGSDGNLTLAEYQKLGGIQGSITAAIEDALLVPESPPVIPVQRDDQLRLLKKTFIPWLADIDAETGERRRRIAEQDELPEEAAPIIERLIDKHLLIKDTQKIDDRGKGESTTVEVAHEALLRNWPQLNEWLRIEKDNLTTSLAVSQAAESWLREERADDWLVHSGLRLQEAEKVLSRADFAQRVGRTGMDYIAVCRKKEDEIAARERRQLDTIAAQQAKTARQQKRITALLGIGIISILVVAGWQLKTRMDTVELQSELLAASSRNQPHNDPKGIGLRLSLAAVQHNFFGPPPGNVVNNLNRAIEQTRLRVRILAHNATVYHADFSPDGRRMVTGSGDGTARIWTLEGDEIITVEHPQDLENSNRIVYATFSPDGRRLVTASYDGSARIWNEAGDELSILQHEGIVWHATFSPDGRRVATASEDGRGRIWNSDTGALLFTIDHEGPVNHIAFSPSGNRVITASFDSRAQVWMTEGGGQLLFEIEHQDKVNHAVFSPDGQRIITSSGDFTARVSDLNGNELYSVTHDHEVWHSAFSADGSKLATASFDMTASVWDDYGNKLFTAPHDDWVTIAEFSPDGDQLLTISGDTYAILWDATSGEQNFVMQHDRALRHAAFSPGGDRVITASADNTAALWDITLETRYRLPHEQAVNYAAFSPDNELLSTVSDDGSLRVWNRAGEEVLSKDLGSPVSQVVISSDGDRFATAKEGGKVQMWSRAGELLFEFANDGVIDRPADAGDDDPTGAENRPGEITHIAFSPTSRSLAIATEDGTMRLLNEYGVAMFPPIAHDDIVHYVGFAPDGGRLVTASEDQTARVWDLTGQQLLEVRHDHRVTHAAFSPDGTRLLTGSTDDTARLIDLNSGTTLQVYPHIGNITRSMFSHDGELVVLASDDNTVKGWDSGGDMVFILQHNNPVNHVEFSPDGTRLVTASDDDTGRIWDVSGEELYVIQHDDDVLHAAYSPDGQRIVTVSRDDTAVVTDTSWLIQRSWRDALEQACDKWSAASGVSLVDVEDIRISPLLRNQEGEDLCDNFRQ